MAQQDTDQWWRERRQLARKLLDQGKFLTAYEVIRPAALPAKEDYRADYHFMCGWIALRYLDEPASAREHFAHIDEGRQTRSCWRARITGAAAPPKPSAKRCDANEL